MARPTLTTADHHSVGFHPWLTIQLARWLSSISARTTLALDDFGTGFSSLSSLHKLPVDVIKIDRSFVTPIETSAHHRVLIEAIVHVARNLGVVAVAEGIETAGEAALLQTLGCDSGQGYFYARPMSAERATSWLDGHRATVSHHLAVPAI